MRRYSSIASSEREFFPEAPGVEDPDWSGSGDLQQVPIPGHEDIYLSRHRLCQNHSVRGVPNDDVENWGVLDNNRLPPQEYLHFLDRFGGGLKLVPENAPQLRKNRLSYYEIMIGQNRLEEVRT